MAKKQPNPTVPIQPKSVSGGWLPSRPDDFWIRLQVYPNAIWHKEIGKEYEHKAKTISQKTGLANLRYLCETAQIAYRPDHDSVEQLANLLLPSASRKE